MSLPRSIGTLAAVIGLAAPLALAAWANSDPATTANLQAQARSLAQQPALPVSLARHLPVDRSGRKQMGEASVHSVRFQGRHLADGRRIDHRGNAAASKTLPIGTVAKVTNLDNGRTAVVKVQDRSPYIDGRAVDVSGSTARQLGITRNEDVAPVVIAPVAVPQESGAVTAGAGATPGPATAQ
jgi:rare lipoprotein A